MKKKYKVSIVIIVAIIFIIAFGSLSIRLRVSNNSSDMDAYTMTLFDKEYTGVYKGKLDSAKQPQGKGTFECDDFSYVGTWKNGTLKKGTIEYKTGTIQKVNFKKGKLTGKSEIIKKNSSQVIFYQDGKPIGTTLTYNNENELVSLDRYFKNYLISDLIKKSKKVDYRELINDQYSYVNLPIHITATVTYLEQDKDTCYLKLTDENGYVYILQYRNVYADAVEQCVVPNLKKGDSVEVYGLFDGIKEFQYSNKEDEFGFSYPYIVPFYCTITDKPIYFPVTSFEYSYSNVCKNPYLYVGIQNEFTATVNKIKISYGAKKMVLQIIDDNKQEYYLEYRFGDESEIPIYGDVITFTGEYNGNKKVKGKNNWKTYPLLKTSEIKIN